MVPMTIEALWHKRQMSMLSKVQRTVEVPQMQFFVKVVDVNVHHPATSSCSSCGAVLSWCLNVCSSTR